MAAFMIGAVLITAIVCATIIVWKYIEECDMDISYARYREIMRTIEEIKKILNGKE